MSTLRNRLGMPSGESNPEASGQMMCNADIFVVGKLMAEMLDYGFSSGQKSALELQCRQIVARLLQASAASAVKLRVPDSSHDQERSRSLLTLKTEFLGLAAEADRNKAGLALE